MSYELASDSSIGSDTYYDSVEKHGPRLCDLPKELIERIIHFIWEPQPTFSGLYYVRTATRVDSNVLFAMASTCRALRSMLGPKIWYGVSILPTNEPILQHVEDDFSTGLIPLPAITNDKEDRYLFN